MTAPEPPDDGPPADSSTGPSPPTPGSIGPQAVRRVAELCQLEVDEAEIVGLSADFERILAAFATLAEVDVSEVLPLTHPAELSGPSRADSLRASTPRQVLLERAPDARDGFYAVPKVIEEST